MRQLVYTIFISNNHPSFHLRWKKNLVKHWKVSKYYETDCRSIKAIYIYTSERSDYALSENGIIYYGMTYCFRDISVWNRRILLDFCWVSIFFDTLMTNTSWMKTQTHMKHTIFWKSVMRTFRWIYLNCFNRLRFLAEVSTKL